MNTKHAPGAFTVAALLPWQADELQAQLSAAIREGLSCEEFRALWPATRPASDHQAPAAP